MKTFGEVAEEHQRAIAKTMEYAIREWKGKLTACKREKAKLEKYEDDKSILYEQLLDSIEFLEQLVQEREPILHELKMTPSMRKKPAKRVTA